MNEDPRCCGSGVCIINPEGYCWCGQKWDGSQMIHPGIDPQLVAVIAAQKPGDEG